MTDDEEAKKFFDFTNRGWPEATRTKWETLPASTKYLWIERMKRARAHKKGTQ